MEKIDQNNNKESFSKKIHMNISNQNFRKSIKKNMNTDRSVSKLQPNLQSHYDNSFKSKQNRVCFNRKNSNTAIIAINQYDKNKQNSFQSNQKAFKTIEYLTSLKRGQKPIQNKKNQKQNDHNQYLLRSCKSSTITPKSYQNQILGDQQLQKLKIFNYINDKNSMQDSIQMVEFIKQAVANTLHIKQNESQTYTKSQIDKSNDILLKKIKSQQQKHKTGYKIGETRRQIKKIQQWIMDKLQFHKENQLKGESIITNRILYLNMAFVDSSKIAGCFSTQLKQLLQYLHKQYDNYYNYVFQCLTKQNKKIMSEMQLIQTKLQNTIIHYEEKQSNIKKQQEERSIKVIKNFKKCIQMKQVAEKQVKYYKSIYNQEKKKTKVMEEGLLKVISLFLTLGEKSIQQLVILPDKTMTNLGKSSKKILSKSKNQIQASESNQIQKRKKIFQQWCGYIIKMVMKIINQNPKNLPGKTATQSSYIGDLAFQIIQKYLVDNDSNLSMKDAEVLLNNFISTDINLQKIKKNNFKNKQQDFYMTNLQEMNAHFNNLYRQVQYQLPTIEQVIKRNKMKNIQTQVCLKNQTSDASIQLHVNTDQIGFQIKPRTKQKGICMREHIENKLNVEIVLSLNEQIKVPIIKQQKNNQIKTESKKVQLKHYDNSGRFSSQSIPTNFKFATLAQTQTKSELNSHFNHKNICSFQSIGINTDEFTILQLKKKKTVDFSIIQEDICEISNTIKDISTPNSQLQFDKTQESDPLINQNFSHKIKRARKNGIYINAKKKTQISMKFIAAQTQQSSDSDDQKSQQQQTLKSNKIKNTTKTERKINFQMTNNNIRKSEDGKQKKDKYQTLQERINKNRSFFNLEDIEFSSKIEADINRIKHLAMKAPKKKLARQRLIDSHDFHIQLAFKNQEKMKFISSVTLWHPRYISQFKKTRNKIYIHPQNVQVNTKNFNITKSFIKNTIDPILREYVKIFTKQQKTDPFMMTDSLNRSCDFGFNGFTNTFPVSRQRQKQINKVNSNQDIFGYCHRLSPLAFLILNIANSVIKTKSQTNLLFNCLKAFKQVNIKIQVYNSLIEGGCVQLDIFIRALHFFNFHLNSFAHSQQTVSYYSLAANIFDVLQGYCSAVDCEKILKNVLKINKQSSAQNQRYYSVLKTQHKLDFTDSKEKTQISLFLIIKCIFKYIKERQAIQLKKYQIIQQVISKNCLSTYYQDLKYFLQCLPLPNSKKSKILSKCLKYTIYWQKNQPTIPNDILYFIFDNLQLYNGSNTDGLTVIKQYLINRCELYFKGTLSKVAKNPDWVLQQTYLLFYKTPKLFHRLSHQAKITKSNGNKKLILCLLTIIFCNLIDSQMDKRFLPCLLNGLIAIPNI